MVVGMTKRCPVKLRRAKRPEKRLLARGLAKWRPGILPGGLTSRRKHIIPEQFDQNQLAIGTRVEMEHTNRPGIAVEIAMDHLLEDRCYYAKLERMERRR